ncbi:MAG: class I SAM-dependent methyltransferase [Proteobacteria bacterium]|nr:class I SAM-dependent methyltransferase [Pseudomonadota bacterium]
MVSYGPVAKYYDDLMSSVDYDLWFSHYMGLLSLSARPIERVLELGCGTGNFTRRLLAHFSVVAVDASEAMLSEARVKFSDSDRVSWICADMACFVADGEFDAAVAAFDVMNYVPDIASLEAVCRSVAAKICRGGRFIFDVNTQEAFQKRLFDEDVTDCARDYAHVWRGHYDPDTRIERVEMQFCCGEDRFREVHEQRAHTREEIRHALQVSGFERIYFFDAAMMTVPCDASDRWIVCATKR